MPQEMYAFRPPTRPQDPPYSSQNTIPVQALRICSPYAKAEFSSERPMYPRTHNTHTQKPCHRTNPLLVGRSAGQTGGALLAGDDSGPPAHVVGSCCVVVVVVVAGYWRVRTAYYIGAFWFRDINTFVICRQERKKQQGKKKRKPKIKKPKKRKRSPTRARAGLRWPGLLFMYPADLIRSEPTSSREIPGGPVRLSLQPLPEPRCGQARVRVALLPGLGMCCRPHPVPQTDVGCSRTPSTDNAALTEGEIFFDPGAFAVMSSSFFRFSLSSSPSHLLCFLDKATRRKEGKKEKRKKNP